MHVEHTYCYNPAQPNPYHTSVHAADVTLTVAHFCENSASTGGLMLLLLYLRLLSLVGVASIVIVVVVVVVRAIVSVFGGWNNVSVSCK